MPTTSNFGWTTPADTDLVKDGAAAIRTLGNGIDSSFLDLKGGTTGQILSKNSGTDLDFVWVANDQGDITAVTAGTGISGGGTSGAVTITNSMATEITAAGDIIVGTGSGTFDNLPIGTTNQVLTADTTVSPYKVKWANVNAGSMTLLESGTLSGASVTTGTLSSSYKHLELYIYNQKTASSNLEARIRFNGDTATNYDTGSPVPSGARSFSRSYIKLATDTTSGTPYGFIRAVIPLYSTSGFWRIVTNDFINNQSDTAFWAGRDISYWKNTGAVSSITMLPESGNWSSGTYEVYGVK